VRIELFNPSADESRLQACYQMALAAMPEDDPNAPPWSFGNFRGWWVHGAAGVPQQTWLATTDAGELIGCYILELPERENRANAFCYPIVALSSRRRGVGTALVAHAAEQAELAGRALLMSNARVGGPGAAFAAGIGARPGMRDARRVLDVGPALRERLAGLRADAAARAAGYSLRCWSGPVPDDMVDQVCSLLDAMEDAPHEDSVETMRWDPARLRAAEERGIAQGSRWYQIAAMHDASGDMAALTQVSADPEIDGWAFQDITAVTRPHRGHRLGLHVKLAMLEWLAETEPHVRHIVTFNAVQNEHMIAVNAELGHRVSDYFESFELDVGAARKLAAAR
jgi:GNAT superfamily N-acetyltransferase/RimJ/RimL family protein N-acetyltransferase